MWENLVPIGFTAISFLISIFCYKKTQEAKNSKQQFDEFRATNEKIDELHSQIYEMKEEIRNVNIALSKLNQVNNYVEFTQTERKSKLLTKKLSLLEENVKKEEELMPMSERKHAELRNKITGTKKSILQNSLLISVVPYLLLRNIPVHLDISEDSLFPIEYIISKRDQLGGFKFELTILWVFLTVRAVNRVVNIFVKDS